STTEDWGWEGSAFWFRGPNNSVRNNVIADANAYGFTYMMLGNMNPAQPNYPGADTTLSGQYTKTNWKAVPLRELNNNEVYGTASGMTVWDLGAACCTGIFELPESLVKDMKLWNVGGRGFYGYGENRTTFDGWTQYGDSGVFRRGNEYTI